MHAKIRYRKIRLMNKGNYNVLIFIAINNYSALEHTNLPVC